MKSPAAPSLVRASGFVPLLISCATLTLRAQPLVVDPAFAPQLLDQGSAATTTALLALEDGGFFAYGQPQWLDGEPVGAVLRLTADGARDPSFVFAGDAADQPLAVLPLSGSRALVLSHAIDSSSGNIRAEMKRYLADGSLDSAYPPLVFVGTPNLTTRRAPSGRIYVAGEFISVGGADRTKIARLNADGTFDPTFAPAAIASTDHVASLVVGTDDAVIVSGWIGDSPAAGFLLRLKADGSRDDSFLPDVEGAYSWQFEPLLVQSDGKVILRTTFRRLNVDGSADDTFVSGLPEGQSVVAVAALPDDRLVVHTTSISANEVRSDVFVLAADGALRADFADLLSADELIDLAAITPGGGIIVRHGPSPYFFPIYLAGAGWTLVDPGRFAYVPPPRISWFARIKSDLTVDGPFAATLAHTGTVEQLASGPDDTVIISGEFTLVNGTPRSGIARLHADGSLDDSMAPPDGNDRYSLIRQLDDGRMLAYIARATPPLPGIPELSRNGIVRLLVDGTLDPTFTAASELYFAPAHVRAIEDDGSIIVSKPSDTANFVVMARYTADGVHVADLPTRFPARPPVYTTETADASTTTPLAEPNTFYDPIREVRLAPDGGMVVFGNFNPIAAPFLPAGTVRLRADGTIDNDYSARISEFVSPQAVGLLRDGRSLFRVLDFIHGPVSSRTIRVNADGTLDPSFRDIDYDYLYSPIELSDGSIIDLTYGLRKWFADGSVDANVQVQLQENPYVLGTDVLQTGDGGLYLGGNFTAVDDEPRTGLAHLVPDITPGITVSPAPETTVAGHTARFSAAVGDGGPVSYQWQYNGVDIAGATHADLIIENVGADDAGSYRAVITAGGSTYTSEAATLTVNASDARLLNFSARSRVSADALPQIAGFVTRATGAAHPVLLRAIELHLGTGSSPQVIPRLGLFQGADEIASDTDSADTPAILTISRRLGAFDPPDWQPVPGLFLNQDAALATDLATGAYTAQTSATSVGGGICLFEFYDAASAPQPGIVLNASLRGRTAPGNDTMIAGIVIGGTEPLRVLVRVVGPELADWDVADPLGDPVLTLFDRWGQRLASNNNWENQSDGGLADVIGATRSSGAFDLTPGGTSAALFVSLVPGSYTVHATANTAGTANKTISAAGEVLLEIYVVSE